MVDQPASRRRAGSRWVTTLLLVLAIGVPVLAAVFRLGPMVTGPTRWLLRAMVVLAPLIVALLVWRRLRGDPPTAR